MAKKRKTLPKGLQHLLEEGNIEALKEQFLRCEPNAKTYSKYGSNIFSMTPLPREFAFWAQEQGADINFKDYYDKTPIFVHASAWNGDAALLLELGAEADVTDHFGVTPLHCAALYGRADAVRALLSTGIDPNVKSGKINLAGPMTPLEEMFHQNRIPYAEMLEICNILLENGAEITENVRKYLLKSAEQFQWEKRGIRNQEFLYSQTENLERLCQMLGVTCAEEPIFHDGTSPIRIPEQREEDTFQWLWNYLVPPNGKAQTAQGETIRIAGRVHNEIMGNGGINWDDDYRKMLQIFPQYLRMGIPLSDAEIAQAAWIVKRLWNGRDFADSATDLCTYAVMWVRNNPEVLPLLETDYSR